MPTFRCGRVIALLDERPGLQRVTVAFDHPGQSGDRAYVLTSVTGRVEPGQRVVCNTTAVDLGLGTGGWHVVHWNMDAGDVVMPGPEHIMKLRYTSLQSDVGSAELDHPEIDLPLGGVPVVACALHSQMGVAAVVARALLPKARIAYVMTDGASLPLALSDLVVRLVAEGVIDVTVTAGQSVGGDYEAVNVASALGVARHLAGADLILVSMGPGMVGTGTTLGTSAVEVATTLDAARRSGGEPILAVRASEADPRERHRGISHHTLTAARRTFSRPWVAPVPPEARSLASVRICDVELPDVPQVLAAAGVNISSMGRSPDEDRLFFDAAGAAAGVAAILLASGD